MARSIKRPACAGCGKPYGSCDTQEHRTIVKVGEPAPPLPTNQRVVREQRWAARTGEEQVFRRTWDGESFILPYEPFCTLRCALNFARRMIARGYRDAL